MSRTPPLHRVSVSVPPMKRSGIGRLVKRLGPIKSQCGEDLDVTRLRLIWVEETDLSTADEACGCIEITSFRKRVADAAKKVVENEIGHLAPQYSMEDEWLVHRFGQI